MPDLGTMNVTNYIEMKGSNITSPINAGNSVDIGVNFYINGTNQISNILDRVEVYFETDKGTLSSNVVYTKNGIAEVSYIPNSANNQEIIANMLIKP